MADHPRSADRIGSFTFRMTVAEKQQLQREAHERGYSSVQQLLEERVFGQAKPGRRSGPQPQQEALLESA